jgi:hypothetical protein
MAASTTATGDSDISMRGRYDVTERKGKERTIGRWGVKGVTVVEGIIRST